MQGLHLQLSGGSSDPSDNNASERGIRKLKIKLKNSGTFRSDLGADAFFDLHSIIETTSFL